MAHEDAVYLAKLAEQAERYEGMSALMMCFRAEQPLTLGPRYQRWSTT
jgi:hypothetical protein